jgi:hypothetical protein
MVFKIRNFLFLFCDDEEPHQGRVLWTDLWVVNPRYITPPARTKMRKYETIKL